MSHYTPYPAYKDSGVEWIGRVPEHWEVKRLRHVATLNPSPDWQALEQQQREYPFLPMEAIGEAGELDCSGRKLLDDCRSGYTYFAEGDVAYAKVTPCFENGKGAVMRGLDGGHGFGTTELTVLRPTAIDRDYLYALTFADSFRQPGASEMLGSGGLKRVPDEFTRNYRAAIPPPAEQTAIAVALDRETARIDALVEKKTRFIELLKEKRQALIRQAVTKGLDPKVKMKDSGVEWIGEVPEGWETLRIKRAMQLRNERRNDAPEGWTYIGLEDVESDSGKYAPTAGASRQSEGSMVSVFKAGDVLYGKLRPYLRKAIVAERDGVCSTEFLVLSEGRSKAPWVHRWLLTEEVTQQIEAGCDGAKMPRADWEHVGSIQMPLPPPAEQTAIAAALDRETARIDSLIAKTQRSIALLKERGSALITAAVTGQIDLRESA